jgi:hypothetical protein
VRRALFLAALLTGCASYEKDLRVICDSPNQIDAAADPTEAPMLLAQHISERIRTREAKNLMSSLAKPGVDPELRPKILAAEAAKHGIEKCALAEQQSAAIDERLGGASYTDDLQAICSAADFSAIESIAAVTDSGQNLVRTLGNIGIGESARVEMLAREAKAHRVMPCDVVSK